MCWARSLNEHPRFARCIDRRSIRLPIRWAVCRTRAHQQLALATRSIRVLSAFLHDRGPSASGRCPSQRSRRFEQASRRTEHPGKPAAGGPFAQTRRCWPTSKFASAGQTATSARSPRQSRASTMPASIDPLVLIPASSRCAPATDSTRQRSWSAASTERWKSCRAQFIEHAKIVVQGWRSV